MEMLFSVWVPEGALVSLALIGRAYRGTWLAPSAFAPAVWSIFIFLPLLALADRVSASTVWAIVLIIFSLQVGSLLAEDTKRRCESTLSVRDRMRGVFVELALRIGVTFTLTALVGTIIFVQQGLRRFDLSLSLESFMNLGGMYYPVLVGGDAEPWWFRLARMCVFPSVLLGGVVAALDVPRWKKALGALALLPTFIEGVAVASRFTITMAVCTWVASYLAAKTYCSGGRYRLGRKMILVAASIGLSCSVLYISLGIVRGHEYNGTEDVSVAVRGNLLGYLPVFDNWFQGSSDKNLTWGAYSLAGIYDVLGLRAREVALGYEPVVLESGVSSNVETAFRGLIQDFSLPGAVLLCCAVGMIAGLAYNKSCRGDLNGAVFLAGFYAFLLWSPIVSIFNYNTFILALLVGSLVVRTCRTRIATQAAQRYLVPGITQPA